MNPTTILARLPQPDTNNGRGVTRTLNGFGHKLQATYWSRAGKEVVRIDVRTAFAPRGLFVEGQTIDDQEGNPYVIADAREGDDGAFREARLTAVRADVWAREEANEQREAEYRATAADSRLPQVKALLKEAIEQTGMGWYTDVYQDVETGTLHVGGTTSTGFKTHPRQDGKHVLYRVCDEDHYGALRDGRELQAMAVAAVAELRQG